MLLQVSVLGRPVPDSATSFRSILSVPDEKAVIIPARLRPDPLGRSSKRLTTTGCKWVSANARRYQVPAASGLRTPFANSVSFSSVRFSYSRRPARRGSALRRREERELHSRKLH